MVAMTSENKRFIIFLLSWCELNSSGAWAENADEMHAHLTFKPLEFALTAACGRGKYCKSESNVLGENQE